MSGDPEGDAEARLVAVMVGAWEAGPAVELDAVLVGIASAVEAAPAGARDALRGRGARALGLLAETSFEEREHALASGFPSVHELERHLARGRAELRALDAAVELDPLHPGASEATLRIASCLEAWLDVLLSRRLLRAWLGPERAARRAERDAVRRRRDRALAHLAGLAARGSAPAPRASASGPEAHVEDDAPDDRDRPTPLVPRTHDDRPTIRAA